MSKAVRVSDDVYERAVKKSKRDDISIIDAVDQMALSEGEEEPDDQEVEEIDEESDDQPADEETDEDDEVPPLDERFDAGEPDDLPVDETDEEPVEESEMCVSDEARKKAEEIAEERGVPISEVGDEVIDEFADGEITEEAGEELNDQPIEEAGGGAEDEVIGYCRGCGYAFRESDKEGTWLPAPISGDVVECPTDSCVKSGSRIGVSMLADEVPDHMEKPIRADSKN